MRKQLQKFFAKKKNNKGFTLIELIIVIAILAILVGIVGMASIRYVEKSRVSADKQTLDSVSTAAQAAIIDPEHGITLTTGAQIKVTADGTVSIVDDNKFHFAVSTYTKEDFYKDIKNDLAKTPKLNSQEYKDGATLAFSVEDNNVKVDENGWQKVTP